MSTTARRFTPYDIGSKKCGDYLDGDKFNDSNKLTDDKNPAGKMRCAEVAMLEQLKREMLRLSLSKCR
jgi:hypothetical protein